ncbi:hypothetical protein [Sorangium sp. So ce590]|uniref:hypothetical protein n=1 Tax=unclassified Sorangium TaxID=2621164 RepID=UPI003F60675D
MALILGATGFSAGCGDDGDTGSGGGTTASSTTSTSGTTGTGGEGGEGGAGEGGAGGEGGSGVACASCAAPLLLGADPDDLCASSKEKYDAVTACLCAECGAAEGDACYDSCDPETDVAPNEACTTCGQTAAAVGGACEAEGIACIEDRGE